MSRRAQYHILSFTDDTVTIRDDWTDRCNCMTVTNDAERVVEELQKIPTVAGKRILYYDTEGQLDELLHRDGKFAGFAPGPRG